MGTPVHVALVFFQEFPQLLPGLLGQVLVVLLFPVIQLHPGLDGLQLLPGLLPFLLPLALLLHLLFGLSPHGFL